MTKNKNETLNTATHSGAATLVKQPLFIFPKWRMLPDFPWQIWAVGWLAIFKAILWLSTNPNVPSPQAELLTAKFLIAMIPFIVLGIGVWNLRKWAVWGLIALAIVDLLFFVVVPGSSRYVTGGNFWVLSIVLLIFDGPLGNIFILIAAPVMLKHAKKSERFIF